MQLGLVMLVLSGLALSTSANPVFAASDGATEAPIVAASTAPSATPAPAMADDVARGEQYDVLSNVLTDPQRKILDRDSRCHDARSATDAFVASNGKALQTGVDAMVALEKCATLTRIGEDWSDYRDYVITAAAALAYKVGSAAGDERLLKRAVSDASHVSGFDASNATVMTYGASETQPMSHPGSNTSTGHGMGQGPAQSDMRTVKEAKHVAAYQGPYGKIATTIAGAASIRLESLPPSHPQAK